MRKVSIKMMLFLFLVVFVFSFSGCSGFGATKSEDSESSTSQSDVPQSEETAETKTTEENLTEEDGTLFEISTVYGTLYFPAEWADNVLIQEEDGDSSCTVTFSTEINGTSYELFSVIIGEVVEESVGALTDANGDTRNVAISFNDFGDLSVLSEEEQDQLYAMQEAINIVIENLR